MSSVSSTSKLENLLLKPLKSLPEMELRELGGLEFSCSVGLVEA